MSSIITLTNAYLMRIMKRGFEKCQMKQKVLIKILNNNGWFLLRHGSNHDIYSNGSYNISVPRHKEIKERTACGILSEAGIEWRG